MDILTKVFALFFDLFTNSREVCTRHCSLLEMEVIVLMCKICSRLYMTYILQKKKEVYLYENCFQFECAVDPIASEVSCVVTYDLICKCKR